MSYSAFTRIFHFPFRASASILSGIAILSSVSFSPAQTPAFPGALGYGAYATGGRNGSVYHVTTLADSGPGSFRDAVSHSGRTVVFDVGGHVTLKSAVSVQNNITIAGQTAPGGICFDAGEISFSSRRNIICRYIRIRPGSDTASTDDDCLGMYRTTNAILDHVSLEFGPYNNIDAVNSDAVSVQNCINANPIGQQFGAHVESYGAWSWQYNIFANSHNRNPLAKTGDTFINNAEYNCSAGYTTHTSGQHSHDIVNNYFVYGPASGGNFPWYQVDNNQSIYEPGNYLDSNKNSALDGGITTVYWYQGDGGGTVLSAPWSSWTTMIPTVSAALAWRYDISAAGAFPRDDVDSLVISQMQTLGNGSTGTGAGTVGPDGGLYTSQTQTGLSNNGYGTFTGGIAPSNFSGDGIADYWKLANNLSTNIAYPLTNTADGYTLLEHYLNFLGAPHAVTQTNTPVLINLAQFTAGFSSAIFSVVNATNGTVSIVSGTNANFIPSENFSGLGHFTFNVSEGGYTLSAIVTVCVTPVAPPASATNFNGALIAVSLAAQSPPSDLSWHGDGIGNVWNLTASNWMDGGNLSAFRNNDTVTFDDTGSNFPAINLTETVLPGAIFVSADHDYTFSGSGALSGTGTLTKTGSGTLTIGTINNTFSGAVNVSGGTLALNSGAGIGSGPVRLQGATISLPGGHTATYIASVNVPSGQTGNITSGYIADGISGNLTGGDASSVLNIDGGLSLSGDNSSQFDGFPGTIHILSGGRIRFSANSSGNTYGSTAPTFAIDGTLQPRNAGNTILLGSLSGSGTLSGPQSNAGSGDTLYVIGGNGSDATFDGVISSNSAVAGSAVGVTKNGGGTLTLTGNSTYTGGTMVNAGTLRVLNTVGSATGSGDLEISGGATLTGNGIIGSATTIDDNATLAPGNPVGGLTFSGNLTLNDNSILQFALGTNSDLVAVGGNLLLTGQLNVVKAGGFGVGVYKLFTCAGALVFDNFTLASAPVGFNYSFNTNTPGVVKLIVSPTTPPNFGDVILNGNKLVLHGGNGVPLGNYYVLTSTNLSLPLANWTRVATNQFDAGGSFALTNGIITNAPRGFYRLQSP